MSLVKRALLYVTRKRVRNILLLLVIFVLSTFMLLGISVKTSADQAARELEKSMGSSFLLEIDDQNPANYGPPQEKDGYTFQIYEGPVITPEFLDEIMSIDGVTDYFADVNKLIWTELELRPGAWAEERRYYRQHPEYLKKHFTTMDEIVLNTQQTDLYCCNDGELHSLFRTGALEITAGRNIQEGGRFQAVISEGLAAQNGLSVGDPFVVENKEGLYRPSSSPFKTWGEPMELTIVGLFHANFKQESSIYTYENGYSDNFIFTDMETSRQVAANLWEHGVGDGQDGYYEKVTFFVENPRMLDWILTQVRTMEGVDGILLELDDVAYRASVRPLQQMSGFSSFLMIASMLGVVIVLYLVLNMWTKGRKREIGVLLSLGLTKAKIRGQLVVECMLVAVAALILSFPAAGYAVNGFGTFAETLAAPEPQDELYEVEFDQQFNPVIEQVSSEPVQLDYELDIYTVFLIAGLILGLTAGSVCLASLQPLRMKPKDILSSF